MRFVGLLATAVLLGVGAYAASTAIPDGDDETALVPAAPAATPDASKPAAADKPRKPKYTRAQRRARAAAVGVLREQGYRPVTLTDYKPDKTLRVLIGRGDGGQRAFFFAGGSYIGNDALDDSHRIEVVRAGNRSISLQYRLFRPDDRPCCPSAGKARVLFRWDGESLAAQTAIPPAGERRAPAG
jgi:LppP/LprE lipoprotein